MGHHHSNHAHATVHLNSLDAVQKRTEGRVGKLPVSGRYHRYPRTITDDYEMTKKVVGGGYNGAVYMATARNGGWPVAVKGFKLRGITDEKRAELESECEVFLCMDHPHVARLVDVYESPERLELVMEYMAGGELFERVIARKRFSERDAVETCHQMLLAVNYIHMHGVVHRDIKLENFLYESKDGDHLKLIDFGFSKMTTPNRRMAASCGTLAYVAPEVLCKNYDSQCDMWSLGVTIFIVLFGYMPFSGPEEKQVHDIKIGKFSYKPDVWRHVSKKGQHFVESLLVVDPKTRLTAEEALKHPWIAEREQLGDAALDANIVEALCEFAQVSAFKRACYSMMAWSLSAEERAKVRNAFLEFDTEHTGAIKLSEFKEVLETRFHLDDERITTLFRSLDMNHHDEIQYSEFLAAMVATRLELHEDMLRQAFKRFDVDDSGYITPENLREVLGETFDGQQVDQIMKEADLLHDGRISYAEWIDYLTGAGAADHHKEVADKVLQTQLKRDGKWLNRLRSFSPRMSK
mmetsp:Transcript_26730/g.58110  ORF Transcript_26730/g.58110 Transcript_26730/m.58110 type:complete len:521 (-) Transcript_26730:117-1679(-)